MGMYIDLVSNILSKKDYDDFVAGKYYINTHTLELINKEDIDKEVATIKTITNNEYQDYEIRYGY